MRFALSLSLSLSLLAAGACAPPDLSGDWDGVVTCDGFPVDLAFTLAATEDAGEYQGEGEASASGGGTDFLMTFSLEVEHGEATDGGLSLAVDVEDCASPDGGTWPCFDAALTWDEGDDEIQGTVSGFPVNSGDCEVEVER